MAGIIIHGVTTTFTDMVAMVTEDMVMALVTEDITDTEITMDTVGEEITDTVTEAMEATGAVQVVLLQDATNQKDVH